MANPLPFVEIPGFSAAVRREQELRDLSFLDFPEDIAGIPVRPFTLRDLVALDGMKNGFVVPFVFESQDERNTQAMQFLWYMSTAYRLPRGWIDRVWMARRQAAFVSRAMHLSHGERLLQAIRDYLNEAFYDNPYSGGGDSAETPKAAYVVYIVDQLYHAGYPWSEAQILAMPLKKLWQYVRISLNRLHPALTLANRSDVIAVDFIAKQNEAAAARAKEAACG